MDGHDEVRKSAENAIAALKKAAEIARREVGLPSIRSDLIEAKELLDRECRVTEEMLNRRVII